MSELDFLEASRLGPLVKVKRAFCPQHGELRPECMALPLTATSEALAFYAECEAHWAFCMGKGCESGLLLEAEATEERLYETLVLWYGDTPEERAALGFDPDKPRIIIELRPVAPGVWKGGSALESYLEAERARAAV